MKRAAGASEQAPGRLRPEKQQAIMAGGRTVFARDGYARASIDAIAAASGVSTRTIYKHFADKASLFAAVINHSAGQIADAEIALIATHLAPVTAAGQVEAALLAFATEWLDDRGAWLAGIPHAIEHRALISQVQAEAGHVGEQVIAEWWRSGPGRVRAEQAALFADWGKAGLLRIPDSEQAAVHFSALVAVIPGPPGTSLSAADRRGWVASGVRLFVRGHQP
ncbi:MAG: TetR/AcrR family transcriptional regulator [Propionibacteriales bacterium]|nr:TetR/AcrR family transcriptional regulator [Propionibacteriales bacterium]